MSKKAYSDKEREIIRTELMKRAETLFRKKGLQSTSIDEIYAPVGISKTFFYSFFPSKIHLAEAVINDEFVKIRISFHGNVWDYGAENGMKETLKEMVDGKYYFPTIEDQAYMRNQMSEAELSAFQDGLSDVFADMLNTIGIPETRLEPGVFCNLMMSILITGTIQENSTVLMYPDVSTKVSGIQIDEFVSYVLRMKVN